MECSLHMYQQNFLNNDLQVNPQNLSPWKDVFTYSTSTVDHILFSLTCSGIISMMASIQLDSTMAQLYETKVSEYLYRPA